MTSPSLEHAFSSFLTARNIGLTIGVCGSSYLFWGNIALARMGAMHFVKRERRERLGISPAQALQLWEAFFDPGLRNFLPSGLTASAAFFLVGYFGNDPKFIRTLLYIASGFCFLIGPFTAIFIAPINSSLKAQLRAAEARSKNGPAYPELSTAQEKADALAGLDRWRNRSAVRTAIAGVGWVAAVLALLLH